MIIISKVKSTENDLIQKCTEDQEEIDSQYSASQFSVTSKIRSLLVEYKCTEIHLI